MLANAPNCEKEKLNCEAWHLVTTLLCWVVVVVVVGGTEAVEDVVVVVDVAVVVVDVAVVVDVVDWDTVVLVVVVEDDKEAVVPQELRTTAPSIRTTSEELKRFGSLIDVDVSFGYLGFRGQISQRSKWK